MKKINRITKEQEARIPEFIDKYLSMPLKEFDDEAVPLTVKRMYASMGESEPVVLVFDSPMACEIIGNFLTTVGGNSQLGSQLDSQLSSQLYSQLYSQLDNQLYSQLHSQLHSQLSSQLDSQLYSQLHNQLDNQLRNQLRNQLSSQLYSQLYSQLHNQLSSQLGSQLYSQLHNQLDNQLHNQLKDQEIRRRGLTSAWWLSWAGLYDFSRSIGVEFDPTKFKLFRDFICQVIYAVPIKGVCIVSRKPTKINWKSKLLHAEGEKAVEFRDGWGWYAYNGIAIPEHIGSVKPSEWKAEWVLASDRADLRALLVSGMGPQRFIESIGGKCIDHFYSPVNHPVKGKITQIVELFEPDFSKFNPVHKFKVLHLTCPSTELDHYHWVPSEFRTAREAYSWFWKGRTPEQMTIEA